MAAGTGRDSQPENIRRAVEGSLKRLRVETIDLYYTGPIRTCRSKTSPAQLAIAWLVAQKPWIVPIPDTTNRQHLEENVGVATVTLTADELGEVRTALSVIKVQGARTPESVLKDL